MGGENRPSGQRATRPAEPGRHRDHDRRGNEPKAIQADAQWAVRAQQYVGQTGVAASYIDPSGGVTLDDATIPATRTGDEPITAGQRVEVVSVQVGSIGQEERIDIGPDGVTRQRPDPVTIFVRAIG